jgi:hypothetical protein
MGKNKYSNVGKRQIISVLNEAIRKIQIIEFTLDAYIEFSGEEIAKEFDEFMIKKLGGNNELQSDDAVNGEENNSDNNEDS